MGRKKKEKIQFQEVPDLNHEQIRLQYWLRQVRFKKCLFGGVRESDVWKKIAELESIYQAALSAERARYDTLLKLSKLPEQEAEHEVEF